MRLLLDEHHDAEVARQLRQLGHDVVAVTERHELRGLPDPEIFSMATAEDRVVVTENARDYVPLVRQAAGRDLPNYGVIITSPDRYPRRPDSRKRLIDALASLLAAHREHDAARDVVMWL